MSEVHQCPECGRFHCPVCGDAYSDTHRAKGLSWVGHEPDGEIEHMVMRQRDKPESPTFRMCEAKP